MISRFLNSWHREYKFTQVVLITSLVLLFTLWFTSLRYIKPNFIITPTPPGKHLIKLFSMGDDAFIYRHFGYKIQMAGDTYGVTTPLKDYSFAKLQKWFFLLNEFDNKSEYVPAIGGLYFSNSQNPNDNMYIVDYLLHFAKQDVNKFWRWITTAMYLSNTKIHDVTRLKEATDLMMTTDKNIVPLWARTLGIFMMKADDPCAAIEFLTQISQQELQDIMEDKVISAGGEANPFQKLIVLRLQDIKKDPSIIRTCLNRKSKIS